MAKLTFNRIKKALVENDRSNLELADHLGVRRQTVSSWCTNSNQPEMATLFQIADFLKVEARELLVLKKDVKEVGGKGKVAKKNVRKKG